MADYTAVKFDEVEAIFGGAFHRVRAALGVTSFGMQVIDMAPNLTQYPEHDHSDGNQEEVFIPLRGGGEIDIDGERVPLEVGGAVRVGASAKRKIYPGGEGLRVLALGGTPGEVYEPNPITDLGGPDPTAQ
jgi:mannose-6-phosphate isomerase-like protein (cupin superfamily)